MSEVTLEELKKQADALGIQYSPNIGFSKLQEKISEAGVSYIKSDSAKESKSTSTEQTRQEAIRTIKAQEEENKKTKVVKVSMVDKREASYATSAYFSTGDIAAHIPLDVFVQLPVILIKMAESALALVHAEANGHTTPKMQKKYVIEYKN